MRSHLLVASLAWRRCLMGVCAPELESPGSKHEPLGLPSEAIERIARNAGVEDANCARRVLRAYEHSDERRARDAQLVDAAVRSFERRVRYGSDIER
jgi:hypothetical protein